MFGELGVSTRLVTLLRTVYGMAPDEANNYLAIFFALLLTGRIIFTMADPRRLSNRRSLVIELLALECDAGVRHSPSPGLVRDLLV